jgi:hypothetical protein
MLCMGVDWIHLAEDKDSWHALMNMMKILSSWEGGGLLLK